jgi:type VI secretion system protein ImpE
MQGFSIYTLIGRKLKIRMTKAKDLFAAGKVTEAISALGTWLRDNPADVSQRTFLFELLCVAGQYDRAEKQLSVLSQGSKEAQLGATMYYAALHAERERNELFRTQAFPATQASDQLSGTLNGKRFSSFRDADPDLGARMEVYAAGAYLWIPFRHITSIAMGPPKHLRDTIWPSAMVQTGPSFKGMELGQVIVPGVYPFSWKDEDESVWLGRSTVWGADDEGHEYPVGQKIFLVDGEEFPLLELRTLEFDAVEEAEPEPPQTTPEAKAATE